MHLSSGHTRASKSRRLRKIQKRTRRKIHLCDVVAINVLKTSVQVQGSAHASSRLVLPPSRKFPSCRDHLAVLARFLSLLLLEVLEPSEPAPDWKTDGWTAPPHPSPATITNSPVKSTYIYELFINLPTLIYDPWLDLTLDSLGVFLSFFLSLWDFFLRFTFLI